MIRIRKSFRSSSWGLVDQATTMLIGVGVTIAVARASTPSAFGAFAIGFSVYLLAIEANRAVTGEPWVIRAADAAAINKREISAAMGTAVVLGIAIGVPLCSITLLASSAMGSTLLALAIFLPGLLAHDSARYVLMAAGRPRAVLLADVMWAVSAAGAYLALQTISVPSPARVVLVWGVAGQLALGLALFRLRLFPDLYSWRTWVRTSRELWPRFLGESLVLVASAQVVILVTAWMAGVAAAGAFRAAQVMLGPVYFLFAAARFALLPELVRRASRDPARFFRTIVAGSCALAAVSAGWTALVLSLPDGVGGALVGTTWGPSRAVVLPLGMFFVAAGVSTALLLGLRALGAARQSLRARLIVAALSLPLGTLGAHVEGAPGAASGLALAAMIGVAAWYRGFASALDRLGRPPRAGAYPVTASARDVASGLAHAERTRIQ